MRHLLELHTDLASALAAQGRTAWHIEDCAALENPALYRTEPADAWRRLKGLGRLRPAEQSVARALAAWREQRATDSDKPRGWILSDEGLYALATSMPDSPESLERLPSLPPALVRKRGDELLALMRQARDAAAGIEAAPAPQRPTPEQTRKVARLQERLRDIAARLGVSAEVLATRRDVEALAFGAPDDSPLLRGWRREVVGLPLQELVDG